MVENTTSKNKRSNGVSTVFVAKISGLVVSFLILSIFASELGAAAVGVFFLFQSISGILLLGVDGGLNGAVEKRISGKFSTGEVIWIVVVLKFILFIILMLGISVSSRWLNHYLGEELSWVLFLNIVVTDLCLLGKKVLNGNSQITMSAKSSIFHNLVFALSSALMYLFHYGSLSLIYAIVFGRVSQLFLLSYFIIDLDELNPIRLNLDTLDNIIKYAKHDFIAGAGWKVFSYLDVLVIGYFLSATHVGAYEMVWRITSVTTIFAQSIVTSSFPLISSWHSDSKIGRVSSIVEDMISPSFMFTVPFFMGVLAVGDTFLATIFGEEFLIASSAFVTLSMLCIIRGPSEIYARTLQAVDRPSAVSYTMLVGIPSNLVLNVYLVNTMGVLGAALATTISYSIMFVFRTYSLSNVIELRIDTHHCLWITCSSAIMYIVVNTWASSMSSERIISLLLLIGGGVVIYTSLIYPLEKSERIISMWVR